MTTATQTPQPFTAENFARAFGIPVAELHPSVVDTLNTSNLSYVAPQAAERDAIILQISKHLESDRPTLVGEHRAAIWESCWAENLQRIGDDVGNKKRLFPSFIRAGLPIRLRQDFVLPLAENFEVIHLIACVLHLCTRYMNDCRSIYEFGCGSGSNIATMAEVRPDAKFVGLDWAKSSNETVNLIGARTGLNICGQPFDFFNPDPALSLDAAAGVLTVCALEQVGPRHQTFVEFLLRQRPAVCVHLEPIAEFYDDDNLVDHLALRYHKKRGYLDGFLTSLRELETEGRLRILDARRLGFGSLYHEGCSVIAWQPT